MIGRYLAAAGFALVSTTAFAGGTYTSYGHSGGVPATYGYAKGHYVDDCGRCEPRRYHRKRKLRMESSIARAGLGGDSIVRANNDSRTTPVLYFYYD